MERTLTISPLLSSLAHKQVSPTSTGHYDAGRHQPKTESAIAAENRAWLVRKKTMYKRVYMYM